jgi:hypothetical protein
LKRLSILFLAASLLGCNPAARCKSTSECGAGVCTGGFCSDVSTFTPSGDGGEAEDLDSADAGQADDAGVVDYDAGTNGRGP